MSHDVAKDDGLAHERIPLKSFDPFIEDVGLKTASVIRDIRDP